MLTRPGCPLCEDAVAALHEYLRARADATAAIEVEEVDIESDDELHRRYLERIPVIRVGGRTVSELTFEPDLFEDALNRHARGGG